jgi:hypothetical protein
MESFQPRRSARLAAKASADTNVQSAAALPANTFAQSAANAGSGNASALPFKPRTPQTRARAAVGRKAIGFAIQLTDNDIAVRRNGFIASIHFICDHSAIIKAERPRLIEVLKRKIAVEPFLRTIPDILAAIQRFEAGPFT